MSAPIKIQRITARDYEIFKKVFVEGRPQRLVAGEYKLSQPRISKIVARLKLWNEQPAPQGIEESNRAERLRGHARLHRARLEFYRDQAMAAFEQSKQPHVGKVYLDAEGKKIKEERSGKTGVWNIKCLDLAARLDKQLLEFDGMDSAGNVDLSTEGRLPEEPKRTVEETMLEMRRLIDSALPKVLAWEAKQREEDKERGTGGDGENGNVDWKMKNEECKMTEGNVDDSRPEQGTPQFRQDLQSDVPSQPLAGTARSTAGSGLLPYVSPNDYTGSGYLFPDESTKPLSKPLSEFETSNYAVNEGYRAGIDQESRVIKPAAGLSGESTTESRTDRGRESLACDDSPLSKDPTRQRLPSPAVGEGGRGDRLKPELQPDEEVFCSQLSPERRAELKAKMEASPYRWSLPSINYVEDDNPKKLPRMTVTPGKQYPMPKRNFNTQTGKWE